MKEGIRKRQKGTEGLLRKKRLWKRVVQNRMLYLFILPMAAVVFVFNYMPMYGIILAFKDFKYSKGIMGSPWAEPLTKYFQQFFNYRFFKDIMVNTVCISLLKILSSFILSVVLALVLNELWSRRYKKVAQTALYLPHFMSWAIVAGFVGRFLSLDYGLLNEIVTAFGGEPVLWLGEAKYFWPIVVLSNLWKEVGWGSILYLAAISGIDQEIYESAVLDGAGRLKQALHITLPNMLPIMGISLTLSMASVLSAGYDQIYLLQTKQTYDVSMVIDTYIMEVGLQQGQYGYATAVGLFQGAIGLVMLLVFNRIARKHFSISLW